jgi:hypothetical protein
MDVTAVVILLAVIVLLVAVAGLVLSTRRRRRSEALQGRFGPEYDRAVDQHGDRRTAESHLAAVSERRDALEIRDLSPADRDSFNEQWIAAQTLFVDDPGGAVRNADRLVADVMRKRGYPVDDFETKVDMVAADHPDVVEHYRAAHRLARQQPDTTTDDRTEDQRQAFVHYRALFAELLGTGGQDRESAADRAQSQSAAGAADDVDLTARDRSGATRQQD